MELPSWLRRLYMRSSSPSLVVSGSRSYVRWFYEAWAKVYDLSTGLDAAYGRNVRRVVEATISPEDRVLDVGVGTGLLAELGAPVVREWVGVDYSSAMLAKAARRLADRQLTNVLLCWGDAARLAFGDARFDAVVSSFALAHLGPHERPDALREMHRVLKPGGRLGLNQAPGEQFPGFSTRDQMTTWLTAAGFVDVRFADFDEVYRIVTARKPDA